MILLWAVDYLDARDKQFRRRELLLDTSGLDMPTQAAIGCLCETAKPGLPERAMLKFRHLFHEVDLEGPELRHFAKADGPFLAFSLMDYVEDENGRELSNSDMARILSGGQSAIMFSPFARPHDIELRLSSPAGSIDAKSISLAQSEIDCLAYFVRDAQELRASEFYKQGPGTLRGRGGQWEIQTATTPDEIRSYVTVFRRLYMTAEPGCFDRAAQLFGEKVRHPLGRWVQGELSEYSGELSAPPPFFPWAAAHDPPTFRVKELLDAFIYTQYAHQPKKSRARLYQNCLHQVPSEQMLCWLFFQAAHRAGTHFANALRPIDGFPAGYLRDSGMTPSFPLQGLHQRHGLGSVEKVEAKQQRVIREKAEELALRLWQQRGRPAGGPALFFRDAEGRIREQLGM